MTDIPLYAGAGFLVGTMVGLTGVGGGSMMTPILMLAFGQSPSVAVGTDLLFSATTKLVATASFGFSRRVDWAIVGRLLLGSVPGSAAVVVGLWLARRTPNAADAITSRSLAIILLVTAVALIFQTQLQRVGLKITARALARVERHKLEFRCPLTQLWGQLFQDTFNFPGGEGANLLPIQVFHRSIFARILWPGN